MDKELHSRQQPLRVIIEIRIGRSARQKERKEGKERNEYGERLGSPLFGRFPLVREGARVRARTVSDARDKRDEDEDEDEEEKAEEEEEEDAGLYFIQDGAVVARSARKKSGRALLVRGGGGGATTKGEAWLFWLINGKEEGGGGGSPTIWPMLSADFGESLRRCVSLPRDENIRGDADAAADVLYRHPHRGSRGSRKFIAVTRP